MDTASQKAPSSCDTKRKGGAPERQNNDVAESIAISGFAGAAQQLTRAGTSSRVVNSGVLIFVGPPELSRCASSIDWFQTSSKEVPGLCLLQKSTRLSP